MEEISSENILPGRTRGRRNVDYAKAAAEARQEQGDDEDDEDDDEDFQEPEDEEMQG